MHRPEHHGAALQAAQPFPAASATDRVHALKNNQQRVHISSLSEGAFRMFSPLRPDAVSVSARATNG
ncbi:DUF2673 domain-containing protein [Halalkalibacter oceani]|uniref:DUF2673 domain-containing protein n=1 Tax=Halalkalibacter oceani TaxID=1653776 RepID=UPI00339222B0